MKRLVILGGGESGVGTAQLGKAKGFQVYVSDFGSIPKEYKDVLKHYGIEWEEGQHTASKILEADVVMKSPGIPETAPIVKQLLSKGISVVSEIEFAAEFTESKIIGVTGSNGKTTTTMMVHHILKHAKIEAVMAGNIGDSFAKKINKNPEYFVLELSSFQLDGIKNFSPNIAIITNITPDHLDRYDNNFETYIASKFKIVMNQTSTDYLIYDADDPVIEAYMKSHKIQSILMPFSLKKSLERGAFYKDKTITIINNKNTLHMPTCLLYTSPSPRDRQKSRMPSSA